MPRFEVNNVTLDVDDSLLNERLSEKLDSGGYEAVEARAASTRVKPGDRVLELGGGVGYISSICATITDPKNIVTVEANPNTVDVIRHNLDLNGASGVNVIHGAVVGDAQDMDTLLFHIGRAFWSSSIATVGSAQKDLVEVPALRISDLLNNHKPDVVIMDIEGAEEHLFDQPWPDFVRQVIIELHPKKYSGRMIQEIFDCMSHSGLAYDPGCSRAALVGFKRVANT
ncbi:FkbM family methyltransferase [Halocynthiibacter namhaensis]|uniref:FkbM family methyltransferase n=1 Tax=Halocynthiibacter namhaensis TaxID=1290553 RepID=UPI0005799409|nr:FkbM family methyltransferase [Halocynthiibacter namhaensis]